MSWKTNLTVLENVQAFSLALLLFTYLVLALASAQIHYLETIHRLTVEKVFAQNVFGSVNADATAAIGFFLLFIVLSFRNSRLAKLASSALFAVAIAAALIDSDALVIGALASTTPAIAGLALYRVRRKRTSMSKNDERIVSTDNLSGVESVSRGVHVPPAHKVGIAFLLVIMVIEIGALARWVTYPLFPTEMYGDFSWRFAEMESALFHTLGSLSPYLVVLIAFSFIYRWYIGDILRKIPRIFRAQKQSRNLSRSSERYSRVQESASDTEMYRPMSFGQADANSPVVATIAKSPSIVTIKRSHLLILSASMVIAATVALYPHLPGINPAGSGVSTDEKYYVNWMSTLRSDGSASWADTIASAFTISKGDRPFTLLLILTIANVSGFSDFLVIRYLPVALAPMLVLATYFLLRFSLKSEDKSRVKIYASIGSIFAAFTPQLVVGEYAGFLANWLALIPTYFAFYFLIKGWDSLQRDRIIRNFCIVFAILLLIMLLHLYTWAQMLATVLSFATMSFLFSRRTVTTPRIKVAIMLTIVGVSFSIDYAISIYFGTPGAAGANSSIVVHIGPEDAATRWDRLFFTLSAYVGGFLSTPVLFILALLWVLKADLSKGLDRLMISMCFILAIPIATGSVEFQTRVLYNIPFHIIALLALYGSNLRNRDSRHLVIIALALTFATYTLRSMANLYLELPEGFTLDSQFLLP